MKLVSFSAVHAYYPVSAPQSTAQHRVSTFPQRLPQCGAQRHASQHLCQDHPVHSTGLTGTQIFKQKNSLHTT